MLTSSPPEMTLETFPLLGGGDGGGEVGTLGPLGGGVVYQAFRNWAVLYGP